MKKTILAAAVAMSFAGFASANSIMMDDVSGLEAQQLADYSAQDSQYNLGLKTADTGVLYSEAEGDINTKITTEKTGFLINKDLTDATKYKIGSFEVTKTTDLQDLVTQIGDEDAGFVKAYNEAKSKASQLELGKTYLAEAKKFLEENKDSVTAVQKTLSDGTVLSLNGDKSDQKISIDATNSTKEAKALVATLASDYDADELAVAALEVTDKKIAEADLAEAKAKEILDTANTLLAQTEQKVVSKVETDSANLKIVAARDAYKAFETAKKSSAAALAKTKDLEKSNKQLVEIAKTDFDDLGEMTTVAKDLAQLKTPFSNFSDSTRDADKATEVTLSNGDKVYILDNGKVFDGADTTDTSNVSEIADPTEVASIKKEIFDGKAKIAGDVKLNAELTIAGKSELVEDTANWAAKGVVSNNRAIVKVADYAVDNRSRIVANEATLVEHDTRISQNKADISELRMDFNDLSADFYEFKSVASKGIAGVAAMSQIDSVYAEVGEVFVGAGVGSFNSEGAVAIGVGYRYSEATSFRAAGSFASGDAEPVFAAGVTYTFK